MIQIESKYDVVVIGSGGAGLRAAIGAAMEGAKVAVLCKGKRNRSGATLLAGANISADVACDGGNLNRLGISDQNKEDSPEKWFEDLIREGFYLNRQELVELFVTTASDRLEEMIRWGLKVRGMEGEREISVFGSDILDVLYGQAQKLNVDFIENQIYSDLLTRDGIVSGALCLDLMTGDLRCYTAQAVVIATGGAHNLFSMNSGSTDLCGEGQASALRAGGTLVDMEMISFCPTVISDPMIYKGNILPYIFFSSGYGDLLNKTGKKFTHRYLSPKVEKLALETEWNKMLLSYALQMEIQSGRGNMHQGIYYTIPKDPVDIKYELYHELPSLKKGIYADIMKIFDEGKSVTVKPAAHYFEGGIQINRNMETNIIGLFAAGECTGGMFGANRVSAATTEMLVEGAKAGENAGKYALKNIKGETDATKLKQLEEELRSPLSRKGGMNTSEALEELRNIVDSSICVIRREKQLKNSLQRLRELEKIVKKEVSIQNSSPIYNREWMEYLQIRNMTLTAGAIIQASLMRKESRGVFIRDDYFITDNKNYLSNVVIVDQNLNSKLEKTDLALMKPEEEIYNYVDYIEKMVHLLNEEV